MADRMTTREAIEIVRDEAKYVSPLVREALLIVAAIAEECMHDNEAEWRGDLCHE